MEWYWFLIITLALLVFMFTLGVPIFVSFLAVNLVGLWLVIGSRGFGMFTNSIYETVTSNTLTTIALFVLMGEVLFRSGAIDVIFDSLDRLLGAVRGRLYYFVISLSAIFGALSGSALAVTAMLGRSALPTMQERGYDEKMSVGLILGGSCLAPIIPPSLMVIIIGSMVDVSIARLLVAGLVPGLIIVAFFVGYVWIATWKNKALTPEVDGRITKHEMGVGRALLNLVPFSIIIFFVLGLIILGVATPSESAATGVLGSLIVASFYGRLSWSMMKMCVLSAVGISAMIIIILASSKLFGQLLAFAGATSGLVSLVAGLDIDPIWILLLLLLIPFIACMFIDQIAFMMVVIPIYTPLVALYGFEQIWFWTLFLIVISVGSLTPPFGYNLFAIKGARPSLSMSTIYRSAWPIVMCFLGALALLIAFPGVVTFLPGVI